MAKTAHVGSGISLIVGNEGWAASNNAWAGRLHAIVPSAWLSDRRFDLILRSRRGPANATMMANTFAAQVVGWGTGHSDISTVVSLLQRRRATITRRCPACPAVLLLFYLDDYATKCPSGDFLIPSSQLDSMDPC
jgi:hypothetical protein